MTPIEHAAIEIVNEAHKRGFCGIALAYTRDVLTKIQDGTYEVPSELSPLAYEMEQQAIHEAAVYEEPKDVEEEIDTKLAKTQGAYKGRRK